MVGTGGTGSSIAEQVTRLGVHDFLLIDPDDLETSNLSRVYGTFPDSLHHDRQAQKTEVIARHLRRINPQARVRAIALNIALNDAARELRNRDASCSARTITGVAQS